MAHNTGRITHRAITFGVLVGTRGFFNPAHAKTARKEILEKLDKLGYNYRIPPADATPTGAVETLKDAKAYAEFFRAHRDEIDGIVVVLPNFGDEQGIAETLSRADLRVPVLIQACNDEIDKVSVSQRRDAYCGKISVTNNLYQYGIPWTDTVEHTCDIVGDIFTTDLDRFSRVCRVVKGLSGARIGAIGARPAPFNTVRYSEKLLQATGITVVPVDLSEIIAAAQRIDTDSSAAKAKMEQVREYGRIPNAIVETNVQKQVSLSVAVEQWMEENECDASAIQCWSSVQNNYGCATCLTMSMMGEKLMPSACEVDVTGVVSMYALALAGGSPPGFLDWNNNYGYERDKVVGTHCSNFPRSFMGNEVEISNLDILGETLGRERCFGAIKGHVAPGPFTFLRMSTDDRLGAIRAYVGEGEFTDDPFPMDGGIAVCRIDGVRDLMRYVTKQGFEHHVAMARDHFAPVLEEAITTYLDWDLYVHHG
ncbi:MAG: fucose isomerase [Spirochaeta sp.]|jgi:L-fucose isomerase-like protein|nr:fucose isomerase [Spirochaeta sp.]